VNFQPCSVVMLLYQHLQRVRHFASTVPSGRPSVCARNVGFPTPSLQFPHARQASSKPDVEATASTLRSLDDLLGSVDEEPQPAAAPAESSPTPLVVSELFCLLMGSEGYSQLQRTCTDLIKWYSASLHSGFPTMLLLSPSTARCLAQG